MNASDLRTLQALFAHPLHHGIRLSEVESLLKSVGAEFQTVDNHRFRACLPDGSFTWIHHSHHSSHSEIDTEAVLALRHFLLAANFTPDHPSLAITGDQDFLKCHCLVLELSHQCTQAFLLSADGSEHMSLKPVGLWGSHQALTNRRERDLAGQRTPIDFAYLHKLIKAIQEADSVLLLGHGHGESDMRHILIEYVKRHQPSLLKRISDQTTVDPQGLTEAQILAVAEHHFGTNQGRHLPVNHA